MSRLKLNHFQALFDYPDANNHAEKRYVTTTPLQKLFLLNSSFMRAQARAFAARLTADPKETDERRIRRAYRALFSRDPAPEETRLALDYLSGSAWEHYAQILLVSNEMSYVD